MLHEKRCLRRGFFRFAKIAEIHADKLIPPAWTEVRSFSAGLGRCAAVRNYRIVINIAGKFVPCAQSVSKSRSWEYNDASRWLPHTGVMGDLWPASYHPSRVTYISL